MVVNVSQKPGEANIRKVEVQLPIDLPSRLTTLHHARTEQQFAENRWGCPKEAFVGGAVAHTPLLKDSLSGPAVLVSHGDAELPDVVLLLHGDGIEVVLDGRTEIKGGITYSKFEAVPDQPIESFEAKFPIGPPRCSRNRLSVHGSAHDARHDCRSERRQGYADERRSGAWLPGYQGCQAG